MRENWTTVKEAQSELERFRHTCGEQDRSSQTKFTIWDWRFPTLCHPCNGMIMSRKQSFSIFIRLIDKDMGSYRNFKKDNLKNKHINYQPSVSSPPQNSNAPAMLSFNELMNG